MIKKIEKITDIMADVISAGAMFILLLFSIFVVGVVTYGLTHQGFKTVYSCAYCQNTISEHADTVICTDGRRYHAECYLRYIEEGENGKTNSEES